MQLTTDIKIFLGIIVGTIVLVVAAVFFMSRNEAPPVSKSTTPISEKILVTPDSHKIGSDSARVTIVEFSDFQCPYCKSAQPFIKTVLAKYPTDVRLVYRYFPIPSHTYGIDSAVAAEAAGRQGKFWEYHDLLFANQPEGTNLDPFKRPALVEYAKSLGLNEAQFNKDLDSDEVRQVVLNERDAGTQIGVTSTPSFFVNGVYLTSGYPGLEAAVAALLNSK